MVVAPITMPLLDAALALLESAPIFVKPAAWGGVVKTLPPRGIGPVRVVHTERNKSSIQKAIYS